VRETLERLCAAWGPSGREEAVAAEVSALLGPVAAVRTDPLGNVIATLRTVAGSGSPAGVPQAAGQGPGPAGPRPRVMLCAHLDQPSLLVTEVTRDGFLRFSPVGHLDPLYLPGQRVVNREGTVGVVVAEDGLVPKDLGPGKLAIDLGVSGREAAERLSAVGDVFCPAAGVLALGDLLSGPALDDRAGCAVLVETARRLVSAGCPNPVDLVFSVQGAIGPRGARPAAHGLGPALALVVDLAPARGVGKSESTVEVGKGPALRVKEPGYVAPPRVRQLLIEAARAAGLPYQVEVVAPEAATSDAGGVELAGSGVVTGVIGLPARLQRGLTPAVSLADLESTVRLLVELLSRPLDRTAPWVTG